MPAKGPMPQWLKSHGCTGDVEKPDVSVTLLAVVIQYLIKAMQRRTDFFWFAVSGYKSSLVGKAWSWESEVAGHIVSAVRRHRGTNPDAQLFFRLFIRLKNPRPRDRAFHIQGRSSLLLNLPGFTLIDTSGGVPSLWFQIRSSLGGRLILHTQHPY